MAILQTFFFVQSAIFEHKKDLFLFSNSVTVEMSSNNHQTKRGNKSIFMLFLYALKLQDRLYTNYEK